MKIVRLKQALYEDLFLLNESDVDHLINYKIKDFDPEESIRFSSFLNMICQTTPIEDLLQLQIYGIGRLFKKRDLVNLYLKPKIIYHRDNLLHYICRIISKEVNGNDTITGKDISSNPNLWKYGKVLLLINNKINFLAYQQDFEREIIKSFPFYFPEGFFRLYTQKIIRYSYIYKQILPHIKQNQKTVLLSGINLIEKKYNIRFDDYIDTIKDLFIWFLGIKETGLNNVRFDMKNKETFYINKERFKGTQVIPTLEALSRDIRGY